MRIYVKNIPARFHPYLIWNNGALGFFDYGHPKKKRRRTTQQQDE